MNEYTDIVLYIIGGTVFIGGGLLTSRLVRPSRPNPLKLTIYESGEEPVGMARTRINARFYVIALIFLLFEVEIIFLFPWAVVFGDKALIESTDGQWSWFVLTEMFIFIGVLALGLAYVWKKGFLDWPKSEIKTTDYRSPVPPRLYDAINEKYKT